LTACVLKQIAAKTMNIEAELIDYITDQVIKRRTATF